MTKWKCGLCLTVGVIGFGLTMVLVTNMNIREEVVVATPEVQKVVLVTYMRSGSSFTGDILQQHSDVFYVYEPLWQTQHNYLDGKPTVYLDGTVNRMDPLLYWSPESESVRVLQNVFRCNFRQLDVSTLRQNHLKSSTSTRPYWECQRAMARRKPANDESSDITTCLDVLTNPCEKAKVIVVKVIRFTMSQLERLLEEDPNVKVIYLLRDPRGSLLSQSSVRQFEWENLRNASRVFCQRVHTDLTLARFLTDGYGDQFLTVRYEDIAERPQSAAKFLYEFMGLSMTNHIRDYIWGITFAGKMPNCSTQVCTTRPNATTAAYRWRNRMSMADAQVIQEQCGDILDLMGYRKFQSLTDLRDSKVSAKLDNFLDGYHVMPSFLLGEKKS